MVIVFDLDNTLYDEKRHLLFAFKKISKYIHEKYRIDKDEIYYFLLEKIYEEDPTYPILSKLIKKYNLPSDELNILLEIYYKAINIISLYKGITDLLKMLKEKETLVLLTDGNPELQKLKIDKLGIKHLFDEIIITDLQFGKVHRKPSPVPFIYIQEKYRDEKFIFIGDNIFKDFVSPNRLNWITVRIRKGLYSGFPNKLVPYDMRPKYTAVSISHMIKILRDSLMNI